LPKKNIAIEVEEELDEDHYTKPVRPETHERPRALSYLVQFAIPLPFLGIYS
jgi:hypothetical protein